MQKKTLYLAGGLGCAFVMFFGCGAVLIMGLLLGTADLEQYQTSGADLWYTLPGKTFEPDQVACTSGWRREATKAVCEELTNLPSIATDVPTRVAVHFQKNSDTVDMVHLTVAPYSPRMQDRGNNVWGVATWAETITEDIDFDRCDSLFLPAFDGAIWDCDGLYYGYSGVLPNFGGITAAHLWIGRDVEQLAGPVAAVAVEGLLQLAESHAESAQQHMANEQYLLADEALVNTYLQYALMPRQSLNPEVRELMEVIAETRARIKPHADAARQSGQSVALPKHRGLLHISALMHSHRDQIEVLLGPPERCVGPECHYTDGIWAVQITYQAQTDLPWEIVFTLPGVDQSPIPMDETALTYFDLPQKKPDRRSNRRIHVSNIAGMEWVEFTGNGVVERVVATGHR